MGIIRTSARALIRRGDDVLVICYRDERGAWYVLPGGGQQHGESLDAALRREVEEETGATISVGPLRFVRECVATAESRTLPPGFHQIELVFACDLLTAPIGALYPDPTQVAVEWRSLRELRTLCFYPQAMLEALERGDQLAYLGVV